MKFLKKENYIYYIEILLCLYSFLYIKLNIRIALFSGVNFIFILLFQIYNLRNVFNQKKLSAKIINVILCCGLIFCSWKIVVIEIIELIEGKIYRDTYVFSDNKNERFKVVTALKANRGVTELIYEKRLGFGIICEKKIAEYEEHLFAKTYSAGKKYLKKTKSSFEYEMFYSYLKEMENPDFCYLNILPIEMDLIVEHRKIE